VGSAKYSPTGYFLCRATSAFWGVLGVLLVYLIGKAMFSQSVGLTAATALTFLPLDVVSSSMFKPDAMVSATILVAFYWSLLALSKGSTGAYALAGVGIALAVSSKLTGVVISVPLAIGSLWLGLKDRRRILLLAVAAVASLAAFFALNPYGIYYLGYVRHLQGDYASRAALEGASRWTVPGAVLASLLDSSIHGPLMGGLALIGGTLLAVSVVFRKLQLMVRTERLMLVLFPVIYTLAYTLATPYYKVNNFVPIVPFTSLFFAWCVICFGGFCRERLPWSRSGLLRGAAAAGLITVLVGPPFLFLYRTVIPTTLDLARGAARQVVRQGLRALILVESWPEREPKALYWNLPIERKPVVIRLDRFDQILVQRLDLCDVEVFPADRLLGEGAAMYWQRRDRLSEEAVLRFVPRPFRVRGRAVVALFHPWRRETNYREIPLRFREGTHTLFGRVPRRFKIGEVVSLVVSIEEELAESLPEPRVSIAATELPLWPAEMPRRARKTWYLTERVVLEERRAIVRLPASAAISKSEDTSAYIASWRPRSLAGSRRRSVEPASPAPN
jgi:hypothetical protein